ncbi:MAG: methionyl-tRNA formyltransferase [Verrucomicrobiales bacterium]
MPPPSPPSSPRRAVFFGTGDIARPAFAALAAQPGIELLGLVTQPDKPVGRHQTLTPPALKSDALALGLPVWQPEKARGFIDELVALDADLFVVMAYGQILPQGLIDLPKLACLNLHASLLPRHRGASPIQSAILAGDTETGITVMHITLELDSGDIVLAEKTSILPGETGGQLHDRLADLAPVAMQRALDALLADTASRTPQDAALVTVLGKLERADGRIDWSRDAAELARQIHAFDPWPGTFTTLPDGKILKLHAPAEALENDSSSVPGTVLASDGSTLLVGCGKGALRLGQVQPEGKRRMPSADFLRGHPIPPGTRLGESPAG